jgi:hypothetical protein
MSRKPRIPKEPKRKAVKLRLCPREHAGSVTEPYRLMDALITSRRPDLADIKIGIVWHTVGWRPDADGVRTWGKAAKHGETERQRTGVDWDIILSEPVWKTLDDRGKERLLAHELEHIQICNDKNGAPLYDDKNRIVTRVGRHNIADFLSIIRDYGLPEALTDVEINDGDRPLLTLAEAKAADSPASDRSQAPSPAPRAATDTDGTERIALVFPGQRRCAAAVQIRPEFGTTSIWRGGYRVQMGNYSTEVSLDGDDYVEGPTRESVLSRVWSLMVRWLEGLELTTPAHRKKCLVMIQRIEAQRPNRLVSYEEDESI